jgi:DNA-binding NarL/FixJ family response regulator
VDPVSDELRVVLADDHHFFREGLRDVLASEGMTVVGEAADGRGAVSLARELAPDVVAIDLNMPDTSSISSIREILATNPEVRVTVLTVSVNQDDVREALEAGAYGYVLKDARTSEIAGAIRQVAAGQGVLAGEIMRALVAGMPVADRASEDVADAAHTLTARELDVLRLLAGGAENAAIGEALSISKHTVKQYVTNILEKLELDNRVQAAVYAVRAGLV